MEKLDELIRQTELQQLQLTLHRQKEKNLEYFRHSNPSIFKKFHDYTPKTLQLGLDTNGHLNLLNIHGGGVPVYPIEPRQFAQAQVRHYLSQPGFFKYKLESSTDKATHSGGRQDQHHLYRDTLKEFQQLDHSPRLTLKTPVGYMLILGCGLGYHIEALLRHFTIYTLYLYESNPDSFYASLHTVDWGSIIARLVENGRGEIRFAIGTAPEYAAIDIKNLPHEIGSHRVIRPYFYTHVDNPSHNKLGTMTRDALLFATRANKAFTQEAGSLAASLSNFSSGHALLKETVKSVPLPPALIVGNGPSLDGQLDFIRDHQDSCVIFCCGSTLSTLTNAGIRPDFQVEIDHRKVVAELYPRYAPDDVRHNICLLASNKVHPDTLAQFAQSRLFLNAGDIGVDLLRSVSALKHVGRVACANPTVTNGGLSFAIELGFREICLLGCDYGSIAPDRTHADNSLHFELSAEKGAKFYRLEGTAQGNFRERIYTTPVFELARDSAQTLLHAHRDVTCYNPNDGILIDGAVTIQLSELHLTKAIAKSKALAALHSTAFADLKAKLPKPEVLENTIRSKVQTLKEYIEKQSLPTTQVEAMDRLDDIFRQIEAMKATDGVTYTVLRSLCDSLLQVISLYSTGAGGEDAIADYYDLGRRRLIALFDQVVLERAPGDLMALDDSHNFTTG